jgi:hypothetical protein
MARRQPTAEQKQRATERRERFQALARMVSAMPADARAALALKAGIRTIEGRELSIFNQCLVAHQRPGAAIVAGFAQWKRAGRSVVKGARGLAIWVPTGRRVACAEEGRAEPAAGDVFSLVDGPEPESGAGASGAVRGFVIGTVFDISQTAMSKGTDEDGEPWDYTAVWAAVAYARGHPEGRAILAAHQEDPADDTTRKALCDWLMERGLIGAEESADGLMLAGLVGA